MSIFRGSALTASIALAAAAWATPREMVTYTNVASDGELGDAANVILTHAFTGGYTARRITLSGTLTSNSGDTYASDARILVTDPLGNQSALVPFTQDGPFGQVTASDYSLDIAPVAAAGTWTFRFFEDIDDNGAGAPDAFWDTITLTLDDQSTPIPPDEWSEVSDGGGDAGSTIATAQAVSGSGNLAAIRGSLTADDVDVYLINITDPMNFSASLVGGAPFDSQLFLFDASGNGVAFDDDSMGTLQSTLTSSFVASRDAGLYLLAVSSYDNDALDAQGRQIWNDAPFAAERAPDGPGAAAPLDNWSGGGFDTGNYRIALSGVSRGGGGCHGQCVADFDDGSGQGHPDGGVTIDDLLYYLGLYNQGAVCADVDNGTGTGTQDGGVTIDDLLYFLARFSAGC